MPGPDYIVDIDGLRATHDRSSSFLGRPWLAVSWKCCSVYSRVYRNRKGTAYEGRCPRCGTPVNAKIGPGGTDQRFFEAA